MAATPTPFVWNSDNSITAEVPKRCKKITGTRLAAILGLNRWSSPFKVWCEITKVYQEPFEDTIYTIAGKTIEPKQYEYLKNNYFLDMRSPEDIYGPDFFKKTWGDFFSDVEIFGGMWDALVLKNGEVSGVVEFKTTKRVEDWATDIPEYYALQAALYAYLLGVDDVYMVCSFLDQSDYADPDAYEPTIANTIVRPFKVSERYPAFKYKEIKQATDFWTIHVLGRVSPEYDEKRDADILKELRTISANEVSDKDGWKTHAEKVAKLQTQLDMLLPPNYKELEKELKAEQKLLKEALITQFEPELGSGYESITVSSGPYTYTLKQSERVDIDKENLIKDCVFTPELFEKYAKITTTYRLSTTREDN